MSPPRLLRQLMPLLCMLSAIAVLTSALFRTHDIPIKDLPDRWHGRSRTGGGEENKQAQPDIEAAEDDLGDGEHRRVSQEGLTGESGLLVDATDRDWGTAELTDEDLSPANVDAILKTEWVYDEENEEATIPDRGDYRELFSLTTRDRKFFPIYFENGTIYDANIMPHPSQHDAWIVLAQNQYPEMGQIICQSGFLNGILICGDERVPLPLKQSPIKGHCGHEYEALQSDTRTVNARMFYGPEVPYVSYAAPSQRTCYGQKLQDGRRLLRPYAVEQFTGQQIFKRPTELQKPAAYKGVEKDYFLFWDTEGKTYVHHDLWPKRVFAELDVDGSVGPNLASETMTKDALCMAKYMPRLEDDFYESIQQATNSLSLTLCKRKDPLCKPTESNTHIAAIFNVASNYDDHLNYEPYLLLFSQKAPFELTAISQRPYWIHGRDVLSTNSSSIQYFGKEAEIPEGHTERFSIAGMSWKTHGQKYHGFVDDVVLLGLGIEDVRAAGIDVLAGDLTEDLAFC